jgi:hypothetical protein
MRTKRTWGRIRAPIEVVVVAALLTMAGRIGAAQQPANAAVQDTTPLTLLLVIFPDTTAAQSAMTNLSTAQEPTTGRADSGQAHAAPAADVQWIEPYYAVVSKEKSGKVTVQDYGKKGDTSRDARAQRSIDGVAAFLGERPSSGGGAAGAGATRAGISTANMQGLQRGLKPGQTGLILVVSEPAVDDVTSEMKQAHASDVNVAPLILVPVQ